MERVVFAPAARRPRLLTASRARLLAIPGWVSLGALVALAACARIVLSTTTVAPWIHPDEQIYAALAESIATSAGFRVRGEAFSAWSFGPLYPLMLSLAYALLDSVPSIYAIAKAANAVLWSLAAVPAYLLARHVLGRNASLGVAAISVLVPSAIYTTKLMTESLAYPLFLAAVVAMVRAVERPSLRADALAIAAIATAVGARAQMVALIPAFVSAIAAAALLERDGEGRMRTLVGRFRLHLATSSMLVLSVFAVTVAAMLGTFDSVLGAKSTMFGQFATVDVPKMFVYHVAELDLASGVIPFVTFAVVSASALGRRATDRSLRLLSIVAVSIVGWLLALVSLYASQPKPYPQIYERYTFYCVPLFAVALFAWASLRVRISRRALLATAVAAAVVPAVLPYGGLLNGAGWGVNSSTVSLVPWALLRHFLGVGPALAASVNPISSCGGRGDEPRPDLRAGTCPEMSAARGTRAVTAPARATGAMPSAPATV
jgi:hypothetical protein